MNELARIAIDRAAAAAGVRARLANSTIAPDRVMTDPLMTYAYSGDASQYRLVPAAVVIVNSEDEVRAVIAAARAEGLPLTFRAAGTSLSRAGDHDGVLAVLGDGFKKMQVLDNGDRIVLGPAIIVAQANRALKPFNRKLGPDPASQATCKIGGVVNNNSSGMCCGVAYNTYHTLQRMRVMLVDGTVLDSGDPASVAAFRESHAELLEALHALHHEVTANEELVKLIRHKYRIKNTVGYSINALVDFHDPIDILVHLDHRLGGHARLCERGDLPHHPRASVQGDGADPLPRSAQRRARHFAARQWRRADHRGRDGGRVYRAAGAATVEHLPAIAPFVHLLGPNSPVILIDVTAPDAGDAGDRAGARPKRSSAKKARPTSTSRPTRRAVAALWDVRKGFFASGGAARPKGTAMMTEDVAAPIDRLADFVIDMRQLLDDHGYEDAIIFGHALAGNLHFQMSDDFAEPGSAEKFDVFNRDLCELVSVRYGGSLKAEHGTGRAIAPFVEREWGSTAYAIMQKIKPLFDPEALLNPGVLITPNQKTHIENLKLMPLADPIVDLCIECGFCEPACPSHQLTLSPRQRIVDDARDGAAAHGPARTMRGCTAMEESFDYAGLYTCAAGNVCAGRCPVGIETGTMVIGERARRQTDGDRRSAGDGGAAHAGDRGGAELPASARRR